MCTAKNSNERIFRIAKMLNDTDMTKGATLSFQSMDGSTLRIIRRNNIKLEVFSALMGRYREEGIPTYTDLIMGMPGETYESTKKGVDELIDKQADIINLFPQLCSMLPNSEMSNLAYVQQHKIKCVRMPILLAHSTPEPESVQEYHDVIIETESMSNEDWRRTYIFYWAIQAFHCLGLLRHIAIFSCKQLGIKYSDFYERLIDYFVDNKGTLIGQQISLVKNLVDSAVKGTGRLDLVLPEFGNIYWPLEEASFLVFIVYKHKFYDEIRSFVEMLASQFNQSVDRTILDDLILYQSAIVKDPNAPEISSIVLRHDFYEYFRVMDNTIIPNLEHFSVRLIIRADLNFAGNLEDYAREVVWYGRRSGRFHYSDIAKESIK
jgi:putative methyltransferase